MPVVRIPGPFSSPASIRRFRTSVTAGNDPVSKTNAKPYCSSIASSAAWSTGGAEEASLHFGSVKWTWLFQNAASTVRPVQSTTRASGGTCTTPRGPTAVMMPWRKTTVASSSGGRSGAT